MTPLLLALVVAANCGNGVDVRVASDLTFQIEATNAPLVSVLECLSERAGFKMVIEPGAAAGQNVTISLSRRSPTQAVFGVLDGQRLNYAYSLDREGFKVLMLLISNRPDPVPAQGAGSGSAPGGPPALRRDPPSPAAEPNSSSGPSNSRFREAAPPGFPPPNPTLPGAVPLGVVPPGEAPLYPEAYPLSPLTLRDSRQIPRALARAKG